MGNGNIDNLPLELMLHPVDLREEEFELITESIQFDHITPNNFILEEKEFMPFANID